MNRRVRMFGWVYAALSIGWVFVPLAGFVRSASADTVALMIIAGGPPATLIIVHGQGQVITGIASYIATSCVLFGAVLAREYSRRQWARRLLTFLVFVTWIVPGTCMVAVAQ